jgi:uncharacterized linocin/CFP29 family protein
MNNLHRELAPISEMAWSEIEEETSRTLKRYLAGRRVVDLKGSSGTALSAIGTGHLRPVAAPEDGVITHQREVKAIVEVRVPFELDRQQIDDVERGANDPTGSPRRMPPARSPLPRTGPSLRAILRRTSSASGKGPAIRC